MVNSTYGSVYRPMAIGSRGYSNPRGHNSVNLGRSQDSSILEGKITSAASNDKVVFTTSHDGDFILSNINNTLHKGDHVKIQVGNSPSGNSGLSGKVMEINHNALNERENNSLTLLNISSNAVNIQQSSDIVSIGQTVKGTLITNNINALLQHLKGESGLFSTSSSMLKSLSDVNIGSSFRLDVLNTIKQEGSNLTATLNNNGELLVDAKLVNDGAGRFKTLMTPFGLLSLTSDVLVPKDHILRLVLRDIKQNPVAADVINAAVGNSIDLLKKIKSSWPAFDRLKNFLSESSKIKELQSELSKIFPGISTNMLSEILEYSNKIKIGNIGSIIHQDSYDKLELLGMGDITEELLEDFKRFNLLYHKDDELGNWQSILIPVFDGENLHYIKVFSRSAEGDGSSQIRFVLELLLESLGEIQIDGLVISQIIPKKKSKVKKFNLVIRSLKAFTSDFQASIRNIFIDNQEIIGVPGMIRFEHVKSFTINPSSEVLKQNSNLNPDGSLRA